ncbi:hypothetical protein [Algoriphagus pacificus]|uniref:DUF5648 domain-containing protein n=1 Tax=Algoriphagus pacificus TaxID=2811234 RepID=A0ABS3CAT2_9BACT|nr:hypothetical protein [Algoriphagus pacificus]MBN7814221.1 hypothetical protein [Algoriphagus pacificus]
MKKTFKFLMPILLITFYSCTTVDDDLLPDQESVEIKSGIDPEFIKYLKLKGYKNPETLKIDELDDKYVVGNQIIFSKEEFHSFLPFYENLNKSNALWREYSYTPTTPLTKRVIPYYIKSTVSSSYRTIIIDAFNTWNNIRNFNIEFEYIGNLPAGPPDNNDIEIDISTENFTVFADGPGPVGVKDHGILLEFNPSKTNLYTSSKKKWLFVQAIGVLIGINPESEGSKWYTDLVPGTRAVEAYTMYNKWLYERLIDGDGIPDWGGFSYSDLVGIRNTWPHDTSEKPLYSYISTGSGWGNWTTDWSLYGSGNSNYGFWGINGYIYSSSRTGTVALYKYIHSSGVPYISTTPNLHISYPSFSFNGTVGYVFSSPGTNRVPVYEWYNPNVGYFFTTNSVDAYVQGPGWVGGGIAHYVLSLL